MGGALIPDRPVVTALSYVVLEVADLDGWIAFARDVLDVMVTRDGDAARIRIDSREFRWELHAAEADRVAALGWELLDDAAVAAWRDAVPGAEPGDGSLRACGALASVLGPGGVRHEVVARPLRTAVPLATPTGTTFVAETLGAGHVVLVLEPLEEMIEFAGTALGLKLTDTISRADRQITFLHCAGSTSRHHSLALTRRAGATELNHLMLEVTEMHRVGRAYERSERAGVVSRELGEHTNDGMFSFYCRTPSGFEIEYGWGGAVIDDQTWRPVDHPASSLWGHAKR